MDRHEMGMHGMDGAMGGWGVFGMIGPLFGLFFMVSLVALALFVALRVFSGRGGFGRTNSAEEILRERFARGEVSAEEYEQSVQVLRDSNPPRKSYEDYIREAMSRLRRDRSPEARR